MIFFNSFLIVRSEYEYFVAIRLIDSDVPSYALSASSRTNSLEKKSGRKVYLTPFKVFIQFYHIVKAYDFAHCFINSV